MEIEYSKILQFIKETLKDKNNIGSMDVHYLLANLYAMPNEKRSTEERAAILQCQIKYNYVELDKIQGCLIGGAAGDALGFAVEFLEDWRIFERYGERGITDYLLSDDIALISDDTQMTLFTAEGILRAAGKSKNPTDDEIVKSIYESYLGWLQTQNSQRKNILYKDTLLLYLDELYNKRAPGLTCIAALESGKFGTFDKPLNESKGCGGIMRIAPIAIYLAQTKEYDKLYEIAEVAARSAAITHGHPLGIIPSGFLGVFISYLLRGDFPGKALQKAKDATKKLFASYNKLFCDYTKYCFDLVDKAVNLACPKNDEDKVEDDLDAIRELGEGWVAEETLAIALYCSLKYINDENGFEKALIASVNHSGDSDSTGALTGNIMGALVGYKNIPQKFKSKLELQNVILDISDMLCIHKLDIKV